MKEKTTRVLLVEDNPGDARLIQEMLKGVGGGYQLEWVSRLADGLERLGQGEVDLVLLDLGLPDSQGLDTFTRAYGQAPQVPFVILSIQDDQTLAITAVRQGAQDYLVKGRLDGDSLVRAMRYARQRKQAEEALRESEEKYRLLVQQIPAVVFRGYPDWSADFFDEKIEVLTGYAKEDFDSRRLKWVDLLPAEDVPQAQQILLEALKTTRSYVREHRIRRKDGEIRWIQGRGQIFCDAAGKIDHIDGVLFDITARKEAEQALKGARDELERRVEERTAALTRTNRLLLEEIERRKRTEVALQASEARYRAIFETTGTATFIIDEDESICLSNSEFERLTGYSKEETEGKKKWQELFHPDDLPRMTEYRGRRKADPGAAPRNYETRLINKHAQVNDIFVTVAPVAQTGKTVVSLLDITDRKRAEAALKKAHDELEQKVAERTAELTLANVQLQLEVEERRRAEGALMQNQLRFQAFMKHLPGVAFMRDREGRYLYANDAWEKAFYRGSQGWFGKTVEEIWPDEIAARFRDNDAVTLSGEAAQSIDALEQEDGVHYWLSHRFPIPDESGRVLLVGGVAIDVTDQKRAEEQLRESEERFRATFEQAAVGIAQVGPDLKWMRVNQKLCDILGYTREELMGGTFQEITHPDDLEPNLDYVRQLLAEEIQNYQMEKRYIRKDGSFFWVNLTVSLAREPSGEPKYFIAVIEDINARKQAEAEVKASETRFRELFNNMGNGVSVFEAADEGRDFVFKDFNRSAEWLDQVRRQEVVGRSVQEAFPGVKEFGLFAVLQRVWQTGKPEYFPANLYKDGRMSGWRENYVYKLPSGEVVAIFEDVTERKEAEEALRKSEQKYRRLVENAQEGIWLIDAEARTTFVNQRMSEMLGYSVEEILGQPVFRFADERWAEQARKNFEERQQGSMGQMDFEFLKKDGSRLYALIEATPIFDDTGHFAGSLGCIIDITERKRAEERLRQSQTRLAEAQRRAHLGNWEWDPVTDESLWSEEVFRIFKMDPAQDPPSYETYLSFIHPDDREMIEKLVAENVSQRAKPFSADYRLLLQDGSVRFVHEEAEQVIDQAGKPGRWVGTIQDITERKLAEERLRDSEEKFRAIFEGGAIGIGLSDMDGRIIASNPAHLQMLGYTAEELKSKTFQDITHPDDLPKNLEQHSELLAGKIDHFQIEKRYIRKDGRIIFGRTSVSLIRGSGGAPLYAIAMVEDITARKQAEEALRASEERYHRLFDASNDAIFVHPPVDNGKQARFSEVNEVACKMLGYSREELLRLSVADIGDPEKVGDFPALRERLRREQHVLFETTLIAKDGGKVPVEISSRLFDLGGQPLVLSVVRDIRERLGAQAALQESEARFSAFMNYLPGVAFMRDREGRLIFANETWERVLHKTRHEWLGTSHEVFQAEAASRLQEHHRRVLETGQSLQTVDVIPHDDGPHTWLTHRFPIFDKDGVATMVGGVAIDITARERAQEALEAERRRLFSLLDELPALVYLVAPDYSIRFTNRVFRESFGQPEGRKCYELLIHEQQPCSQCRTFQVFQTGELQSFEWSPSGESTFQLYEYPFTDVDGSPLVLVLATDITERKFAEKRLQESEKNLRHLASQLLNVQELERKRISRELHDELGQALLVLKLQLHALARQQGKADAGAKEDLNDILAYVDGVVDNVRRLARDLSPTILEDLGFSAALRRLIEGFQKHYNLKECSISLDEINHLLSAEAKINVYRIFQEALTNIGKYARATRVTVKIKKGKGRVSFQLQDNGRGFNIDQVRGRDAAGRGLGLAAMEERVRMLEGTLLLESQEGQGTKICFSVPASEGKGSKRQE